MDQTNRTVQKKRTSNFREDETKLLIQLWGNPFIQKKLYLTHRKAPVMKILAHNMQQRGFCRTPDEIKTRIRNLKCLYHRIKRSMTSGTGIGTVDPDWPHFKAMDAILTRQGHKKTEDIILEGPRCEDIKQEIDVEINDDMESWMINENTESSDQDETPPTPTMPSLHPAPLSKLMKPKLPEVQRTAATPQNKAPNISTAIIPNVTHVAKQSFTIANNNIAKPPGTATVPSYQVPLLILNGLQAGQVVDKNKSGTQALTVSNNAGPLKEINQELCNTLKDLLETQKNFLDLEKKRFEIEKQKLEFEKQVGTQLLTLIPVTEGILQKLSISNQETLNSAEESNSSAVKVFKNIRKRRTVEELSLLRDSKILRTVLEQGIKKYMMDNGDEMDDEDETEIEMKRSDDEEEKDVQIKKKKK